MSEDKLLRPLLNAAADALGMDLRPRVTLHDQGVTGSRKCVLELFEGYSPTIVSSIEDCMIDKANSLVAIKVHIFGNVGAILLVEGRQSHLSLYVYDRSKTPENSNCAPWDSFWSRKKLYYWLGDCVRSVYHRSLFDDTWEELPQGRARVRKYNDNRDRERVSSTEAYRIFWKEED
jgi:hypothetical protein